MEDREIVELYWKRDRSAVAETASKYGGYCKAIAKNILGNSEDAEECVNDTYLRAWNSMPPNRPEVFSAYLGKITRNLSFDRIRNKRAEKRGGGEIDAILDELGEVASGVGSVEDELDRKELVRAIDGFLDDIPKKKRDIFLCRYWYALTVTEIGARFGMSEGNVSVTLNRIRSRLKAYLKERGYDL